jgi:methylglutaconyl-CoA hydratase
LIQEVASDLDDLAKREEKLADLAFTAAPEAVREAKQLVRDVADRPIDMHLAHDTAKRIAKRRASAEGQEGLAAFLEKRPPSWVKRA